MKEQNLYIYIGALLIISIIMLTFLYNPQLISKVNLTSEEGNEIDTEIVTEPVEEQNVVDPSFTSNLNQQQSIYMLKSFYPKIKITKQIENLTLKELFFEKFIDLCFETCVNPNLRNQLINAGALSYDGYIDLTKSGPISIFDLENIMGTKGTSAASDYLRELKLYRLDDSRNVKTIPINSNLAKAYLIQNIKGFCKDNYKLVEKWAKELDIIREDKKNKLIEMKQKEYL